MAIKPAVFLSSQGRGASLPPPPSFSVSQVSRRPPLPATRSSTNLRAVERDDDWASAARAAHVRLEAEEREWNECIAAARAALAEAEEWEWRALRERARVELEQEEGEDDDDAWNARRVHASMIVPRVRSAAPALSFWP